MYTDFYQFSEKPFEDNPDPKFLYLTPSNQEILTSVLTWIKEGQGIAVITGEAGTGKTFFIHVLLSRLDKKINPILVLNPILTFKDLLKQILLELKQPIQEETEPSLFHRFTGCLDQMMTHDETLLIILDEAQNLNDQILEGIDRFLDTRSRSILILFAGQPHFDEKLHSVGLWRLGQKIKIKNKMKPFIEEESYGYLNHRLRLVGSRSEIITPKAIFMICAYTQGIASLINHVCDNALRIGYTMNRGKIDVDIIENVIQNLEGPRMTPKILPFIQSFKEIWRSPIRSARSFKRVSIALLLLVCLAGFFLLIYEYLGGGPMKMQGERSFIEEKLTDQPITHKPSAQGTTNNITKKDRILLADEPLLTQPESTSRHPDAVLLAPGKRKQPLIELIVVKRGETLFWLAKKYYHTDHPTLIDLILETNPEITNADLIKVDQKIKIPEITEDSLVSQSPDHTFKIHVGTFWSPDVPKLYSDEPELKGKTIEVIPLKISPTKILHRVLAGNFQNKDEALKMVFFLKKKGLLPSFKGGLSME